VVAKRANAKLCDSQFLGGFFWKLLVPLTKQLFTFMTETQSTTRKVHILVGATGSVASIKIPKLVHLLRQV
jgi:hypothetical protein